MSTNDKRIPRFRQSNAVTSMISKLITDPNEGKFTRTQGKDGVSPSMQSLGRLSSTITSSSNDAENILATLPDTELTMMVVVSSIVSPNDMRTGELTWAHNYQTISPELSGKMLDHLKGYFEDEYGLKKILPKAIERALFKTGSYPLIVIPESSVDDMINGTSAISTESMKSILDDRFITKSKGILGKGTKDTTNNKTMATSGIESMVMGTRVNPTASSEADAFVSVTDNMDALKIPLLFERQRKMALRNKLAGSGLEALYDVGNLEVTMKRARAGSNKEMQRVMPSNKASRAPVGHPMVITSPSDALIPAHSPSNPEDHLGYYLLLDDMGYPLSNASDSNYYQQIRDMGNQQPDDATSALLKRSRFLQEGINNTPANDLTLDALSQSYAKMLEMDLLERLRNGLYGEAVEIERPDEIYRIMFARACAGQRTQLLYIPVELVTYFAYDYNNLGIGISLLEKSKFLAGVRSMLTYGNLMGQMSNSVPRRNLTITLDDTDMEPEKTVDLILNEYQRVNNGALPLDGGKPFDVINGIRNANTSVNVVGNPMFPETNISVDDVSANRQPIDLALDELFTKRHGMALGVTPDLIDSTSTIEFAVQQLNSNLLFTKRIAMQQEVTSDHLSDHVRKYTTNSGTLMAELIRIIRAHRDDQESASNIENKLKDTEGLLEGLEEEPEGGVPVDNITDPNEGEEVDPYSLLDVKVNFHEKRTEEDLLGKPNLEDDLSELTIIDEFLESMVITLPPPDSTKIANQIEAYNQFGQAVDAVLPAYVSVEMLEYKYGDEGREAAPMIITMIKGFFLRQYLSQNNIMPELRALVASDGEETQLLNMLESSELHLDSMSSTIGSLLEAIVKRYVVPEETPDYSGGVGGGDNEMTTEAPAGSGDLDADAGGDFDMPDDLDFDLDMGEAAPTEEAAPAEAEAPAETPTPAPAPTEAPTPE